MRRVPLLDHFRPPLNTRQHWHAFHNAWATYLSSDLNRRLPPGYFAEAHVQFGIEIDVAAFEEQANVAGSWEPPSPALTLPLTVVTDVVEIAVFRDAGGPTLAGAIGLVSPSNKDREAHREAFVSKCASYVQQGIGLAVVDIVTDRSANLHEPILARVSSLAKAPGAALYAASYRPVKDAAQANGDAKLQLWFDGLELAQPLPTRLPFWLRGGFCLPLDLEATYQRTCDEQRIPS